MLELESELAQETAAKERQQEESKKTLEGVRTDMEEVVAQVREAAEEDKQAALESQRRRLDAHYQERMTNAEQGLLKQLQEVQNYLTVST